MRARLFVRFSQKLTVTDIHFGGTIGSQMSPLQLYFVNVSGKSCCSCSCSTLLCSGIDRKLHRNPSSLRDLLLPRFTNFAAIDVHFISRGTACSENFLWKDEIDPKMYPKEDNIRKSPLAS